MDTEVARMFQFVLADSSYIQVFFHGSSRRRNTDKTFKVVNSRFVHFRAHTVTRVEIICNMYSHRFAL